MGFTEQLLIILSGSLVATILFRRLRLPPIVAYIVVGALAGPDVFNLITEPDRFSLIAEFGVAFLLFAIGLEFSLAMMLRLKYAVFGLGSVQVISCMALFTLAVWLWGTSLNAAIIIAGALALSSTAIVSRELSDLQQFSNHYARLSIGVLLFQDLAAVVFLILIPILGSGDTGGFWSLLLMSLGKGLMFFLVLMGVGKWLLPRVYEEVARSGSEEVFGLSTLVIALLTAWLAHAIGLSMALGGFVIGMMLSESAFKHQITGDIRPFKDVLLGLFFVTVGMNIDLTLIPEYWPRLLLFTCGLVAIKALVVTLVVRIMGESDEVSVRVGLALAQAGEFGLALLTLAQLRGIVPHDQASFIILIAVFSMAASPFMIRQGKPLSAWLLRHLPGRQRAPSAPPISLPHEGHVLIGGFGRVGRTLAGLLEENGIPYIGIDNDIDNVTDSREQGYNVIYGDCTRIEILNTCHLAESRLAVLTFRSVGMARHTVIQIRNKGIEVPVIVRCYEHGNFEELVSLGADRVVSEMLEASLIISSQALSILGIEAGTIEHQLDQIRHRASRPG